MKKKLNLEVCYLYYIAELLCLVLWIACLCKTCKTLCSCYLLSCSFGKAIGCSAGFLCSDSVACAACSIHNQHLELVRHILHTPVFKAICLFFIRIVKLPSSLKNPCITESLGVMSFSNSRKQIPDSSDETRPGFRNTAVSRNSVSWIIVRYRGNHHLSGNMNLLTDVIYVCHLRICSDKCILLLNTTTEQTETHH